MRRIVLALGCALVIAGCGGSTSPSTSAAGGTGTQPAQSSAGGSATSAAAGGPGGALVVTGSLSLTLSEDSNSANMCAAGAGNTVSGILTFGSYALQFSLAIGTTQFPQTTPTSAVAFFNGNDSTQEWAIGTTIAKATAGTATVNAGGKSGTVDADMVPNPPQPNPSLKPIHVKGTFTCS